MISLNESQVWTTIGVLSATLVGTITLVVSLIMRTMRSEFGSVRSEFGSVRGELASMRSEFRAECDSIRTEMRTGFARVHDRLDHLDRDVNALMKHTFGVDRE